MCYSSNRKPVQYFKICTPHSHFWALLHHTALAPTPHLKPRGSVLSPLHTHALMATSGSSLAHLHTADVPAEGANSERLVVQSPHRSWGAPRACLSSPRAGPLIRSRLARGTASRNAHLTVCGWGSLGDLGAAADHRHFCRNVSWGPTPIKREEVILYQHQPSTAPKEERLCEGPWKAQCFQFSHLSASRGA